MAETQYNEDNLNKSPYLEGFSRLPEMDFSSIIIQGDAPLPVISFKKGFSKISSDLLTDLSIQNSSLERRTTDKIN